MIEISDKSKKYIEEVFSEYALVNELLKELYGRTLLHLYPVQDTSNDEDDNLLGFVDALLFDIIIYNNKKKYIIYSRDQVELLIPYSRMRFFKDGSTMIIIDGDIKFGMFQSLEITKGEKFK